MGTSMNAVHSFQLCSYSISNRIHSSIIRSNTKQQQQQYYSRIALNQQYFKNRRRSFTTRPIHSQSVENNDKNSNDISDDEMKRTITAAPIINESIGLSSITTTSSSSDETTIQTAKTNTVNERLMAELQAASDAEKGPQTKMGKKFRDNFRYSEKSDEEREAALEAARDLNGVNPTVTILASFFAFGMAYGFWTATQFLGELFLSHPVSDDAPYAFARMASVFRNVVMGLSSLASGFSAVSGLGVFLLGSRVAYGTYVCI